MAHSNLFDKSGTGVDHPLLAMVDDFFELDCSALILVLFTKQGSQQF
jgi:hypothetical protein